MSFQKKDWGLLSLLSLTWMAYFYYRFGIPISPLDAAGDMSGWEASGHYLWQNLAFMPWPQIDYFTNHHFYPGGLPAAYYSWAFERDYFWAISHELFGAGPWLQTYFFLAELVLIIAAYALLRQRLSRGSAFVFAGLISFGKIYALVKYPGHFGIAICHWTLLGILADGMIAADISEGRRVDHRLILARLFFLVAGFGQDLGYIQGVNLTSAIVVCGYSILASFYHLLKSSKTHFITIIQSFFRDLFAEPRLSLAYSLPLLLVSFFYLPLLLQLF